MCTMERIDIMASDKSFENVEEDDGLTAVVFGYNKTS